MTCESGSLMPFTLDLARGITMAMPILTAMDAMVMMMQFTGELWDLDAPLTCGNLMVMVMAMPFIP